MADSPDSIRDRRDGTAPGVFVPVVAVSPDRKTFQDLCFSYGVVPVLERKPPASWPKYVKSWIREQGLTGEFAILTKRPSIGNHQMEILEL